MTCILTQEIHVKDENHDNCSAPCKMQYIQRRQCHTDIHNPLTQYFLRGNMLFH